MVGHDEALTEDDQRRLDAFIELKRNQAMKARTAEFIQGRLIPACPYKQPAWRPGKD